MASFKERKNIAQHCITQNNNNEKSAGYSYYNENTRNTEKDEI